MLPLIGPLGLPTINSAQIRQSTGMIISCFKEFFESAFFIEAEVGRSLTYVQTKRWQAFCFKRGVFSVSLIHIIGLGLG